MHPPRRSRAPSSSRSAVLLGERLIGFALVLAGLALLALLRLATQFGPGLLVQPQPPPGFPAGSATLLSPFTCLVPVVGLGAFGLILVGFKRMLFPQP
jgi:hypothetical protein